MIDYERDCKAVFAAKLQDDMTGKGRIESAAYHVAKHIYLLGVEDGMKAAGMDAYQIDEVRELLSFS